MEFYETIVLRDLMYIGFFGNVEFTEIVREPLQAVLAAWGAFVGRALHFCRGKQVTMLQSSGFRVFNLCLVRYDTVYGYFVGAYERFAGNCCLQTIR
jgi:hypothetical protein